MSLPESPKVTPRQIYQIRASILAIFVGFPALILGLALLLRPARPATQFIHIQASMAESGGFMPASIEAQVGQKVILDFTSMDTIHSIAIGPGLGIDLGDIQPGAAKQIAVTFERPGRYTYYCNRFCSVNHWRMRGVIEVRDSADMIPDPQRDPVIDALIAQGVNIDMTPEPSDMSMDTSSVVIPRPSPTHGAQIADQFSIPPELNDLNWRRMHTPQEAIERLTVSNPTAHLSELTDVVAYLWTGTSNTTAETARLYSMNCAYCHGESGGGDGPIASLTAKKPVAFSDPALMLNTRADVRYAKIRRGGMGTDMPNFGTLFTPEETWSLVDYLWTLPFQTNDR